MSTRTLDAATVRAAAQGRWNSILPALNINLPTHPRQHGPCPTCGGKDRFRFDDRDGNGSWFCNQCVPHAGDGFSLVMKALNQPFREALMSVGGILNLDPHQCSQPRHPLPPPPVRVDWRARAFACEMAALDRRLRADLIFSALLPTNGAELSDEVRDRLMVVVCRAYSDLWQAERLEYLADLLHAKDFHERRRLR